MESLRQNQRGNERKALPGVRHGAGGKARTQLLGNGKRPAMC